MRLPRQHGAQSQSHADCMLSACAIAPRVRGAEPLHTRRGSQGALRAPCTALTAMPRVCAAGAEAAKNEDCEVTFSGNTHGAAYPDEHLETDVRNRVGIAPADPGWMPHQVPEPWAVPTQRLQPWTRMASRPVLHSALPVLALRSPVCQRSSPRVSSRRWRRAWPPRCSSSPSPAASARAGARRGRRGGARAARSAAPGGSCVIYVRASGGVFTVWRRSCARSRLRAASVE